ncbi:MAG: ABC transporter permease, partial [Candidatus Marinimicrobia bacterium]|nr:ABC transporter permease [Candidatus Neomarinimicrobiota bacterium]
MIQFKIAIRNLIRHKRRTSLTALLIVMGVVLVLLFTGFSKSFKQLIIGQITDSMIGHLQIHKKGYVSSIDNLPLTMNLMDKQVEKIESILTGYPEIEAVSHRIKLGGMLSNFEETTNIRLNAIFPEKEILTCPGLSDRLLTKGAKFQIQPGEIIIPKNLARGMQLKEESTVVIVANNKDGSVNGMTFKVVGILDDLMGPGGRDGFMHYEDALDLLRMDNREVGEIIIKLHDFKTLESVQERLSTEISTLLNQKNQPVYELHDWAQLSPFSTIADMVDLLVITVKIVLISIVLISILNVMIMAVYERVSEIGTLMAMGTRPRKILNMFLMEGFLLGLVSTIAGIILSTGIMFVLRTQQIQFSFGRMKNLSLEPTVSIEEILMVAFTVIGISLLAALQ